MKDVYLAALNDVISFMRNFDPSLESEQITEKTRIEEDLGITGDEAWDFFVEYSKRFNVDVTNFLMYDYFKAEGIDFLSPILEFFRVKKKTVKKVFVVEYLLKGIVAGKLDEDVINDE